MVPNGSQIHLPSFEQTLLILAGIASFRGVILIFLAIILPHCERRVVSLRNTIVIALLLHREQDLLFILITQVNRVGEDRNLKRDNR